MHLAPSVFPVYRFSATSPITHTISNDQTMAASSLELQNALVHTILQTQKFNFIIIIFMNDFYFSNLKCFEFCIEGYEGAGAEQEFVCVDESVAADIGP